MNLIKEYLNKKVEVITCSGHVYVGILIGFDNPINVILKNAQERIFSPTGVTLLDKGLFIVKGDDVMIIGRVQESKDNHIDWQCVIGTSLPKAFL